MFKWWYLNGGCFTCVYDLRWYIGVIKNSISHKHEQNEPRKEAFDALISLGYKSPEVKKLLSNCDSTKLSAEEMIRLALKKVAS